MLNNTNTHENIHPTSPEEALTIIKEFREELAHLQSIFDSVAEACEGVSSR